MLKTHNIEPFSHLNLMVYQHFKDNLKFLHKKPPYVTFSRQTAILHKKPPYGHHFRIFLNSTYISLTNPYKPLVFDEELNLALQTLSYNTP
jgi:hypothetical protein